MPTFSTTPVDRARLLDQPAAVVGRPTSATTPRRPALGPHEAAVTSAASPSSPRTRPSPPHGPRAPRRPGRCRRSVGSALGRVPAPTTSTRSSASRPDIGGTLPVPLLVGSGSRAERGSTWIRWRPPRQARPGDGRGRHRRVPRHPVRPRPVRHPPLRTAGPGTRWEGIRDATEYGPTAPQPDRAFTIIPEPVVPGDDCLNLNVFTPELGSVGLPVLVWIHGGGFTAGGNTEPVVPTATASPATAWSSSASTTGSVSRASSPSRSAREPGRARLDRRARAGCRTTSPRSAVTPTGSRSPASRPAASPAPPCSPRPRRGPLPRRDLHERRHPAAARRSRGRRADPGGRRPGRRRADARGPGRRRSDRLVEAQEPAEQALARATPPAGRPLLPDHRRRPGAGRPLRRDRPRPRRRRSPAARRHRPGGRRPRRPRGAATSTTSKVARRLARLGLDYGAHRGVAQPPTTAPSRGSSSAGRSPPRCSRPGRCGSATPGPGPASRPGCTPSSGRRPTSARSTASTCPSSSTCSTRRAWSRSPGRRPPSRWPTTSTGRSCSFVTEGDPGWAPYEPEHRRTMVWDESSAVVEDPCGRCGRSGTRRPPVPAAPERGRDPTGGLADDVQEELVVLLGVRRVAGFSTSISTRSGSPVGLRAHMSAWLSSSLPVDEQGAPGHVLVERDGVPTLTTRAAAPRRGRRSAACRPRRRRRSGSACSSRSRR